LTRQYVEGSPFVLINGDIVCNKALLLPLLNHTEPTATLVDDRLKLLDGEMNVVIKNGRVIEFSKAIPASLAHAQSLQITKFNAYDGQILFKRINELVANGERNLFPAYAYDTILANSCMAPVFCRSGLWFEIDTFKDIEHAEQTISKLKTTNLPIT